MSTTDATATTIPAPAAEKPQVIVAVVDAPDPDNFAQIAATRKLFPDAIIHVMVTGRPVAFDAPMGEPNWMYDVEDSRAVQIISAARIKAFVKRCGLPNVRVFDGGIAPRTLVPHALHFADYYKFGDVDPVSAIRHPQMEPLCNLIKTLMEVERFSISVGGPMTGLMQLFQHAPALAHRVDVITAMFATFGGVQMMDLGSGPRGAVQFNVACDPVAANYILTGMPKTCRTILMTTDVTRVAAIGFMDPDELNVALCDENERTGNPARELLKLYRIWHENAVKPRQVKEKEKTGTITEKLWIHDLVAALALNPELLDAIYDVIPVTIKNITHRPSESEKEWGTVTMAAANTASEATIFAARALKPGGAERYLAALRWLFA